MKRIITYTVSVALLVAACGQGSDVADSTTSSADQGAETTTTSSDEPTSTVASEPALEGTVTMWIPPIGGDTEQAYWDETIKVFQEEHPGIEVEAVVIPWENRTERLTTALAGGELPDVVYLLPDELAGYANQGVLADVSGIIEDDVDDFQAPALDALSFGGTLYGVPVLMTVTTAFFNQSVVDAVGLEELPETWDDIMGIADQVKDAGFYVTQYDAAPEMTLNGSWYPLLWQAGGEILTEDGSAAAFNGPEGLEALEFVVSLAEGEHVPQDALTTLLPAETSPLARGEVLMAFSKSLGAAQTSGVALDDLVLAPPLMHEEQVSFGTTGGLAIFADTENGVPAEAWIDWVTSPEQLSEYLPSRLYLSPRHSVTGLYDEGTLEAQTEEYVSFMTVGLAHPDGRLIMDTIKPHLQAAILGQVSPQEALDAAAAEVNALLQG